MPSLAPPEEMTLPYPNTCSKCEDRGAFAMWDVRAQEYFLFSGDFVELYDSETQEWHRHTIGWPKRCKDCHAQSEKFRRAHGALKELEEQRSTIQDYFDLYNCSPERWAYLKFVTLTWKQEWTKDPMSKRLASSARKWIRHKRDKIAKHLDVFGGIDVLEFTTKTRLTPAGDTEYYHNLHTHGIWLMPYQDIKFVGEIMTRYVGRDTTRAVKDKVVVVEDNEYVLKAFSRGRKYLLKYLSKHPDSKRSRWGTLRRSISLEDKIITTIQSWSQQ